MFYFVALALIGNLGDVDQALVLYEEALYQSALETLPEHCEKTTSEAVACETVKGLCEVALGNRKAARRAWTRMCLLEPNAPMPPLAPALAALWQRGCRLARWMSGFTLDELVVGNDLAMIRLERPPGPGEKIGALRLGIRHVDDSVFQILALKKVANRWVYETPFALSPGVYDYYLELELKSGERYSVGNMGKPRSGRAVEHFSSEQFSALTHPWPNYSDNSQNEILPEWGWWAVGASIAVIVITSVAVGLSGETAED